MLTAEERKHVQEASIKERVNQKGCANASHQNSKGKQTKQHPLAVPKCPR